MDEGMAMCRWAYYGIEEEEMDDTRPFPIQQGRRERDKDGHLMPRPPACTIPWWLAEEAYKEYKRRFSTDQSLERIAERGGWARQELLWLLRREIPS